MIPTTEFRRIKCKRMESRTPECRTKECRGVCFEQTNTGEYKKRWVMLKCPCDLHTCPCCESLYPQRVLDRYEGLCTRCGIHIDSGITDCPIKLEKLRAQEGVCLACGRHLVPVGRSRMNGKDHNDWEGRQYHKKCWKEYQKEVELKECIEFFNSNPSGS